MAQAGTTLASHPGDLTPLQRQVLMQGWLDIKEEEMEAQANMMGGGKSSGGTSPTAGSVRNGAAASDNTRVEEKSYVNPNAGDPLEDN